MISYFVLISLLLQISFAQVLPYAGRNAGIPNTQQIPAGFPANNLAPNNLYNQQIANENLAFNNDANLAALAGSHLANVNGNVATFNLGNDANSFTVTSGSPGSPGFGIQVQADALEVGGTVSVNGQIPIYGTVAVNGNVPTDGTASVNYNCGQVNTA